MARLIANLHALMESGSEAVAAYEVAIERIGNFRHRHKLSEFFADHQRHIHRVSGWVTRLGAQPDKGLSRRLITRARVLLSYVIGGDRGILDALRMNEALLSERYNKAMSEDAISPDLRKLLRQCLEDIQRHRAWLAVELHRDDRKAA